MPFMTDQHVSAPSRYWLLGGLLVLAVVMRLGWLYAHPSVIESEGACYGRLAESLANGLGLIGIRANGKQIFYPPLYPWVMSLGTWLLGNAETAGRLVAFLSGVVLVLPTYLLGERLFGWRVALVAGMIVAVHPLLLALSVTVLSETLFLSLMMGGLYWGWLAVESSRPWPAAFAGVALGLAYLTRPEAIALLGPIGLVVLVGFWQERMRAVQRMALLVSAFLLFALPYVVFLHAETGQWRLEPKSSDNYAFGIARLEGRPLGEIAFGVDEDLTERGLSMRSNVEVIQSTKVEPARAVQFLMQEARLNFPSVVSSMMNGRSLGSPLLFWLLILGVFAQPWGAGRFLKEGYVLCTLIILITPLATLHFWYIRYLAPVLPLLSLWSARGVLVLADWVAETALLSHRLPQWRLGVTAGVIGMALLILVRLATPEVAAAPEFTAGDVAVKRVGLWIKAREPGAVRVMDYSTVTPFYASAVMVPYPYASPETALRYLDAKGVKYVVVRQSYARYIPYLEQWAQSGIPDGRAELVYTDRTDAQEAIQVYRWHRSGETS